MLTVGEVGDAIINFFTTPPSPELKDSIHGALFNSPSPETVNGIHDSFTQAPNITSVNGKLEHFITDSLVQNFTQLFLHTPNVLAENPTILSLYYFFLKITITFTFAGIVYFGIMQIVNKGSKYQSTEYIVKIIQSMVIINIAIVALPILLEVVNKFTQAILSVGGSEADMVHALNPQYGFGLIIFTLIFALILVNLI
jgi:hypothetical protein